MLILFFVDDGAIQLDGRDYVSYVLRESFDKVFKSIAISFRTESSNGYLFYAKGHDYCFLQVSSPLFVPNIFISSGMHSFGKDVKNLPLCP